MRRVAAIVAFNLVLLFVADRLFGLFRAALPDPLTPAQLVAECYTNNARGYFTFKRDIPGVGTCWTVDRKREADRMHRDTVFVDPHIKVVALGDSFTFGLGVRLEDTWVRRLERTPSKVRIYAGSPAEPGADVETALEQIRRAPPGLKIDAVIYGYVLNDPMVDPTPGCEAAFTIPAPAGLARWDLIGVPDVRMAPAGWFAVLAKHSYLAAALVQAWERRTLTEWTIQYYKDLHDPAKNGPGVARTITLIEQMKAEATRHGARFLVAIFPIFHWTGAGYPFAVQHAFLSGTLRARGIDVIDLQSAYDDHDAEDLWVDPGDHHPNDIAHAIAADRIAAWLREQGIVPRE